MICLSSDESSFYVGYSFSGVVEKYMVATGMLVCSAPCHQGDVHTLALLQPDLLCTSGSDGQVCSDVISAKDDEDYVINLAFICLLVGLFVNGIRLHKKVIGKLS